MVVIKNQHLDYPRWEYAFICEEVP